MLPLASRLVCTAAIFISCLPSVASAGDLDAYWAPSPANAGYAVHNLVTLAQTFQAETTGVLDRVEVQVSRRPNATEPLVLELRRLDPLGDLLATVNISAASIPTLPVATTMTGVDLGAQSFAVTPGDQLAIVAKSTTSGLSEDDASYFWAATISSPGYANGMAWFANSPFNSYQSVEQQDFGFRTFVSVPEPTSLMLAIMALIALVVGKCRKA